ncbi:complement receptor type 1-like [Tiliqua scincoides]|uniref:complement receptor type 1-like n=1 Tax=Tiliqua scincoides TaxID=71010 RepID=UPI003461E071
MHLKVVQCQTPPYIQNGTRSNMETTLFTSGMSVKYTCDPGSVLLGEATVFCTGSGTWSSPAPRCKVMRCHAPPRVVNATYSYHESSASRDGIFVNYTCEPGYNLIGRATLYCTASGMWNLPAPRCEDNCGPPARLHFAELADKFKDMNSFAVNTTVNYVCRPGYAKDPGLKASVTCLGNQTWSEVPEFCKKKSCGHPKEPKNGQLIVPKDLLLGSTVSYTCDEGYRRIGVSSRRCVISNRRVIWTGDVPFCQLIPCYPPPEVPHGRRTGMHKDDFYYGDSVTYTCEKGYPLHGTASIHCTTKDGKNGVWSGQVYCGVVQCQAPPDILNGTRSNMEAKVFTNGTTVKYTCDPGSILIGEATVYCMASGTWSSPAPRCKVVRCHAPPHVDNATYSYHESSAFRDGIFVNYTCEPGYTLTGGATLYCTASGTWNLPAPRCEGSCGPPMRLSFAELANKYQENNSFPVGTTVNYVCRPGYAKHPGLRASVTCLTSQKWAEAQEFCRRRSCGYPGDPENGRSIITDDILLGSTVHYTCDEGHKRIGQTSRQCVVSGRRVMWTGEVPLCLRISCSPPPDVPHGKHSGRYREDFSFATSVTYTCEEGYPMVGNASIHCTTKDGINGVWSDRVYCGVAECPHPVVESGRIVTGHSNTYTPKHKVTFDCNAGHVKVGSGEMYCQVDGTWEPPPPHCELVVQCQTPPYIQNGTRSNMETTLFTSGMSVKYTCDPGSVLLGEATIFCTGSGTWSSPAPRCKVGNCGPPIKLNFAELANKDQENNSFPVGTTVNYVCRRGYAKHPGLKASVKCLTGQKWAEAQEFCRRRSCGYPGEPENGRLIVPDGLLLGSTVNYICDEGHKQIGQSSRQCVVSGRQVMWTGELPLCQRISCSLPPDVPHGKHSGKYREDFSFATSVTYTCEEGYPMVGNASIHCTTKDGINGVWSDRVYCGGVVTGCERPKILNGRTVGFQVWFNPMERITFECDHGHMLKGNRTTQCQFDGTWNPPVPVCARGCPALPEIAHGKADTEILEDFAYGSSVTYHCETGYELTGAPTIHCLSSGSWDQPAPQCKDRQCCPAPPEIAHGKADTEILEDFAYGSSVTYHCETGYELTGAPTIHCLSSGSWDQPAAQLMRCPLPPRVLHGEYIGKNFTLGSSVFYICDTGYSLFGEHVVTCILGGSSAANWSDPPKCKGCPAPPEIAHGKADTEILEDFAYGSSVTYHCETGYDLTGATTIHCLSSGSWNQPAPKCKGRQFTGCVRPDIQNGRIAGSQALFKPTEIITLECNSGYKLKGNHTTACQFDGTWNPPVPMCARVQCQPPPSVYYGSHSNADSAVFTNGMSVNYSCEPGYILIGAATLYCTESGEWFPTTPHCEGEDSGFPGEESGEENLNSKIHPSSSNFFKFIPEIYPTLHPSFMSHCPSPPEIDNGHYSDQALSIFPVDITVWYSCFTGYRLIGKPSITCTESGAWSLPLPYCEATKCVSPEIQNGRTSGFQMLFNPMELITLECDPGYILKGNHTIQCQFDGTWNPPVPICARVMCCPIHPWIVHRDYIGKNIILGDSVFYICDAGYSLVVEHEIKEIRQAAFFQPQLQCQDDKSFLPGCPAPPEIAHGKPDTETLQGFAYGSSLTYHCDTGYFLTGAATIHCLPSGSWDQPVPQCKDGQFTGCSQPEIQNGKTITSQALFQSMERITLECDPGYILKGSNMIQCQSDGTWNPPVPTCAMGYNIAVIGIGSVVGILLLLVISGIIWMVVRKQKKIYYTQANVREISESPDSQVQYSSNGQP